MNKNAILLAVFLSLMFIGSIYATTDTIGGTGSTDNGQGWYWVGNVVASASGTLTSVGINVQSGGGGTEQTFIYSDSGGSPSALLGNSILTSASNGWDDLAIPQTVTISSSTKYWIGVCIVSGGALNVYVTTSPDGTPNGYTNLPCPFSSISIVHTGETANLRMTYSGSTTTTTTSTTTTTTSTSTSSTSTSTTTSTSLPTTTINGQGINVTTGLGGLFVQGFNTIPFFSIGLILLAFGITLTRAKVIAPAIFVAGLIALLIYSINPAIIGVASLVTVVFIMVFLYELWTSKKK